MERTEAEIKRAEEKDRRESLLGAFLAFTQDNLQGSTGAAPRDYLSRRGLTGPALEDLGLYTTREAALAALKSKGFSEEEIKASGVVYDGRWEGRLIIPWRDRWGRLGTFAARDLTGTAEDKEKYLYLSKDHGWGRPKADLVAFGLDHALSRRPDYLLLVEGLLDVVNLQAQGFSNVAAIGGNGRELTETRWAALGVPRVVLLLDNDPETLAGYMGTVAAVENLQKVINTGKVRNVPVLDVVHPSNLGECKDPDLLVRTFGMDALLSVVETRTPAAIFLSLIHI